MKNISPRSFVTELFDRLSIFLTVLLTMIINSTNLWLLMSLSGPQAVAKKLQRPADSLFF